MKYRSLQKHKKVETADKQRPPARRERQDGIANRKRILAAARQLFKSQGVDSTSMNQIAQKAKVGPGTLYRNFANKASLCETLMIDDFRAYQSRITELTDGRKASLPALARLEHLIEESIHLVIEHIPLMLVFQPYEGRPPRPFQTSVYGWMHGQVSTLLAAAVSNGEARDMDIDLTAGVVLLSLSPALLSFWLQNEGFSQERIILGIRQLIFDGLRLR